MGIRYKGEFVGADGAVWCVEILRRGYTGPVDELIFPYDEPLVIDWEETGKEEPVQGSTATLTIESSGDRTYIGLYTVKAGDIMMAVKRDGRLWWTGCLDPEFYEEPYERAANYDVRLTFSDFGILDRIKWDTRDFVTLDWIIQTALTKACIYTEYIDDIGDLGLSAELAPDSAWVPIPADTSGEPTGIYATNISTMLDGKPLRLADIVITGDNYYDEDSEPATWREVLEGILQPLGLRIIQRAGRVLVYDLNAMARGMFSVVIPWSGDSQTLRADKVYNNVQVTFSPYDSKEIYDGSFDTDDLEKTGEEYLFYTDYGKDRIEGFKLLPCKVDPDKLPFTLGPNVTPVRIKSIYSGSDEDALHIFSIGPTPTNSPKDVLGNITDSFSIRAVEGGVDRKDLLGKTEPNADSIMKHHYPKDCKLTPNAQEAIRTTPAYIGGAVDTDCMIQVTLEAMIDLRYNPYEQASEDNESGHHTRLQQWANFAYIPGALLLKDANGKVKYHYNNVEVAGEGNSINNKGEWVKGEPSRPDTYFLAYYNESNRKGDTGLGGWQTNRQCIGSYRGTLPKIYTKRDDGDYIPYPPESGYLELVVYDRFYQTQWQREEYCAIYKHLRWFMLKEPAIKIVDEYGEEIDDADIEYTGWLEPDAKEGLQIDTTCGTTDQPLPSARGVYMRKSDLSQIAALSRAGITDCAEKLLIGTMYSQYATRHHVLSGECDIIDSSDILPAGVDRNMELSRRFMPAGETMDCRAGVSDMVWVEVLPDDYKSVVWDQ